MTEMSEKENKKLIFCSCSKKVWAGSAIVIAILTIIGLYAFDQFPEFDYYEWKEIQFWLWYGLGGGIVLTASGFFGVYCMIHFCRLMREEKTDDSWWIGLICFFIFGTVMIAVIANAEDSWDDTQRHIPSWEKQDQEYKKSGGQTYQGSKSGGLSTGGLDDSYDYTDDNHKKDCSFSSGCTIKQYVEYDITQSINANSGYRDETTAFDAVDNWFEEEDCESLIDWRLRSYAQVARHYAGHKINDLECLNVEAITNTEQDKMSMTDIVTATKGKE